jgi:hypothetical protein
MREGLSDQEAPRGRSEGSFFPAPTPADRDSSQAVRRIAKTMPRAVMGPGQALQELGRGALSPGDGEVVGP